MTSIFLIRPYPASVTEDPPRLLYIVVTTAAAAGAGDLLLMMPDDGCAALWRAPAAVLPPTCWVV